MSSAPAPRISASRSRRCSRGCNAQARPRGRSRASSFRCQWTDSTPLATRPARFPAQPDGFSSSFLPSSCQRAPCRFRDIGCGDAPLVGLVRVELTTSRLSGVRSNHLSYRPRCGSSTHRTGVRRPRPPGRAAYIQKREESLRESELLSAPRSHCPARPNCAPFGSQRSLGQLPLGTDSRVCKQTRYS